MTDRTLCDRFIERVDMFIAGDLSSEDEGEFRAHIRTCGACKALLRLSRHMNEHVPSRIEPSIPDGLDADMWERVSNSLPESQKSTGQEKRRPQSWFMPLLAAAAAVLLFMNGYLMAELRQFREREERIVSYLSNLDHGTDGFPGTRTEFSSGIIELTRFGQTMLQFRPHQRMSIDEWITMLTRIPRETTVLTISDMTRNYGPFEAGYRGFDEYGVDINDGIQVDEAIYLLTSNYEYRNRTVTLRELMDEIPSMLRTNDRRNDSGSVLLQTTKGNQL